MKNDSASAYYVCAGPGCGNVNVAVVKQSLWPADSQALDLERPWKSEQTNYRMNGKYGNEQGYGIHCSHQPIFQVVGGMTDTPN